MKTPKIYKIYVSLVFFFMTFKSNTSFLFKKFNNKISYISLNSEINKDYYFNSNRMFETEYNDFLKEFKPEIFNTNYNEKKKKLSQVFVSSQNYIEDGSYEIFEKNLLYINSFNNNQSDIIYENDTYLIFRIDNKNC